MSVHAVEKVFWEFGNKPSRIDDFRRDPEAYLSRYNLSAEERAMIRQVDLKALAAHGVSTLLTLMVWPLLKGSDEMPFDYLVHMNDGKLPDMGMTGFKAIGLKGYIRFRQMRAALRRAFGKGGPAKVGA
jgi:protocatechuate 4,5-dioxygenase alpha chain